MGNGTGENAWDTFARVQRSLQREQQLRPMINFINGQFTHNFSPCRVVLRKHKISIGCSDVTPEALRELLAQYDRHFGSQKDEVVLQP